MDSRSRRGGADDRSPNILDRLYQWRDWFPVPRPNGRPDVVRWILLGGNRLAVTVMLLVFVFATIVATGTLWTFEMQQLLTETGAVQTLLNTLLSGIILLVSIVVSINSIVLSYDITSLSDQEDRIEGLVEFRYKVGQLTESGRSPTNPASFLSLMAEVIHERSERLKQVSGGDDQEIAEEIEEYVQEVTEVATRLSEPSGGAEFSVLWLGLDVDYGPYMERSQTLRTSYEETATNEFTSRLDELIEAFQLFATGKEYFKTLYYTEEASQLSRTLVIVSLPAILITATTILAINAEILPRVLIFGLPPLLSFVAITFAVALVPFLLLTAYTLRMATVARQTAAGGPFSLES
jgi:hypothetical protein